jgi:hypothetical protein
LAAAHRQSPVGKSKRNRADTAPCERSTQGRTLYRWRAIRTAFEGVDVLAVDIDRDGLSDLQKIGCETFAADITDPAVRTMAADCAHGANYLVNSTGTIVIKLIFEVTLDRLG